MDDILNRSDEDRDRHAKIARVQRDMAILESDLRKSRTISEGFKQELRNIKKKKDVLRAQEDDIAVRLRKSDEQVRLLEEDITRKKKELGTI